MKKGILSIYKNKSEERMQHKTCPKMKQNERKNVALFISTVSNYDRKQNMYYPINIKL